jgi:signal transduction histidine kinase
LSRIEKNQEKAIGFAQKSYNAAKLEGNPIHLATSTTQYAEALYKANKKDEALQFAQESVKYATDVGDKSILIRSLKNAGNLYFENGEKDKAAQYFQQYISINDSIMGVDIPKQINEINTKYETEKKEKLIAEQELKIQKQKSNLLLSIVSGILLVSILGGIYFFNRKANKAKFIQLQTEKENAILNSFIQGEERERNRISHELHDGVAAMLGAAKMSIESIPHLPPDKQNEQLVRIKTILENTHADVRHIAHNLLPIVLEKEGLIKATEHFANELNASKLIQITVTDRESHAEELNSQLQLMLFRVIQELINNTVKHSQAKFAQIEFSRNEKGLQIEVSDDGIGFDGDVNDGNQGLYSISQRLKSIGGNFKFIKKSDRGMKAVAELKV